jgi:hypothetical protein
MFRQAGRWPPLHLAPVSMMMICLSLGGMDWNMSAWSVCRPIKCPGSKGMGLVAEQDISAGDLVLEYKGTRIQRHSELIFVAVATRLP